jgi:hypothetical protein
MKKSKGSKYVYRSVDEMISDLKLGDSLEIRGFDIEEVYKIMESEFNDYDYKGKDEKKYDIFNYAHHTYKAKSRNEFGIPDLFSEIMIIRRVK